MLEKAGPGTGSFLQACSLSGSALRVPNGEGVRAEGHVSS